VNQSEIRMIELGIERPATPITLRCR